MKRAQLVFIPIPGAGHLISMVEMAKHLVDRHDFLSITVLIMKLPFDSKSATYAESLTASTSSDRLQFIILPEPLVSEPSSPIGNKSRVHTFIETQKPLVSEAVSKLTQSESSPDSLGRLAGFVLDMFCVAMIDVANEFGLPSYIYFTSSASFLGFKLYMETRFGERNTGLAEFKDSDAEFVMPSFVNPVPAKVLPTVLFDTDWTMIFLKTAKRFRETKGIMVNTFMELESHAVNSLNSDGKIPTVYPVGPIISEHPLGSGKAQEKEEIIKWLDDHPTSSVVFLCFGSMGSFGEEQVREIACALELSAVRFLWSLRRPLEKGEFASTGDYANPEEVLPEGFLDRTDGIGKIIGWAPQAAILAHSAIGGFVSHCGWNSILESIWFGVPMATWPMYAEQQINAFSMVVELGLAVEIKLDYRKYDTSESTEMIVRDEEIVRGIKCVMEHESEIRKKVKELSEKSRKALNDGGSSSLWLIRLIGDVMDNLA